MATPTPLQSDEALRTGRTARAVPRPGTVVNMRSGWRILALVAVACPGTARAESTSATLQVSAVVLPHVRLQQDSAPIDITAADVLRGYRDVARHYTVETNEFERVLLQLNPRLGLTDRVDITGLLAPLQMMDASLEVAQPLAREFTLTYRLWLNSAAQPGSYQLPVQVAAVLR
jgi:hypothetical protein